MPLGYGFQTCCCNVLATLLRWLIQTAFCDMCTVPLEWTSTKLIARDCVCFPVITIRNWQAHALKEQCIKKNKSYLRNYPCVKKEAQLFPHTDGSFGSLGHRDWNNIRNQLLFVWPAGHWDWKVLQVRHVKHACVKLPAIEIKVNPLNP